MKYVSIAALLGCLVLGGVVWLQTGQLGAERDDNARLTRNAAVLSDQVAQARLAADVASAYRTRETKRVAEATATIEAIRKLNLGECADADIDPALSDILRGL